MKRRLAALLALVGAAIVAGAPATGAPVTRASAAAPARINGSGSTYVALAMQQWVADAQTDGLSINYSATGSPQGLGMFSDGLVDFAGTEAEYSAIGRGEGGRARGYQYVPDVAGAVAIMYNVTDQAGRKVDYLRLSRSTVAKIFMGAVSNWSDPAITADNKGLVLPDQPITVVYRAGESGTTALFYDFVANTEPALFQQWAARHRLPTEVRIIQLDTAADFAPKTLALNGSDQIAQYVAGSQGRWSVAYDEFGYAVTYGATAARIQNYSGDYVLPFAENISAALESAKLRSDLSQDLRDVYASPEPLAYPISAYSYLVTQCAVDPQRATCKGDYANAGVTETLARWMRYIACDGQVTMAQNGYSPLPPNLSQEIVNSIARMKGEPVTEQLHAGNCANPRFHGGLGEGSGSPPDPLDALPDDALSGEGGNGTGGSGGATEGATGPAGATGGAGPEAAAAPSGAAATGLAGAVVAVGGGSATWRAADPVAMRTDRRDDPSLLPVVVLLALVAAPPLVGTVARRRRRPAT